jgi:predicted ATP-dependent protease
MPVDDMLPADIRALRGDRTRAAFATELGVSAHSVYRWELPPDSPHARRPRGAELARLRARAVASAKPALALTAATVNAVAGDDPTAAPVSIALQRMLDGDWRDAEGQFLRALSDRSASPAAHVLASTGLASIDLFFRADGRRALAALGPALSPTAPPLALAESIAALAYSYPDGELFDVGRVHAHAARAELLARGEAPIVVAIGIAAEANAALLSGDDDLLVRALSRVDDVTLAAMPEIPAMFVEMLRSLAASRQGQARLANDRLERLLAHPRIAASPPLEARICGMRALRSLDELGDPEAALALARRARQISDHLAVGVHTGIALRAEAEALMRLGRMSEVSDVFAAADKILDEERFPATIVLAAQARFLLFAGRKDDLLAMAGKLAAIELPSIRPICQAYAAWFTANAALSSGDEPAATMAAFAHADRLCGRWQPMQRDLLLAYASAALVDGDPIEARAILARARRVADRSPTAWATAQLRRVEGTLLVAEGHLAEGRTMFEAVGATFDASGDRLDAILARYGSARMLATLGDPDGPPRLELAEAELRAIGLPHPSWIDRACRRAAAALQSGPRASGLGPRAERAPALEVALQRIAVTGATTTMIRRELVAVAQELSAGEVTLFDLPEARGPRPEALFDVSPALRFSVSGPLSDATRSALRVIALVAGLALETAALRGGEVAAATPDETIDVPGLVAVSPAMRRVLADVGRLAGSRATVVVSGESGVGKELIARALHQLSPRAGKPYVAFNCAAVPHELFEGQLFGYRKGAFTGATSDHPGVIRAADGGTLFLDEVGELPLDIQPKLLRFLDNAEVFPLGAQRPITVDVRVIAATNRDLALEVRRGAFREDLYYRLLVVPLVVPPLRARREDIIPLARHFARSLTDDHRPPPFAPDAQAALVAHAWPGNVRELRNVISRALAYSPRPDLITRAQLGI